MTDLAELVEEFRRTSNPDAERPKAATLEEAIRIAALSTGPDGKRHAHQRRIPWSVLQAFYKRILKQIDTLSAANSFREIHAILEREAIEISGAGELLVYDVALRIALYLGIRPLEVYLHAGARTGARNLKSRGWDIKGKVVPVIKFPPELRVITADEIESFLCQFADRIKSN